MAAGFNGAAHRVDRNRISAISDECANCPSEAIAFARQYGLRWLELRAVPGSKQSYEAMPEPELRAAAKEFAESRVGISFLDASLLKFALPGTEPARRRAESEEARARRLRQEAERFERRLEEATRAIRAARILDTDKLRIFSFSRVEEPAKLMPRLVQILEPMVALAAEEKVRLLVENEGSCNVATSAELAELMRRLPSEWLGINWDPLNGTPFGEVPFPEGYRLLPVNRVGNVHIKGRSILDYPQRMDWKAIFEAFARDGYHGCFGLETHIFGPQLVESSHAAMKEILRIVG